MAILSDTSRAAHIIPRFNHRLLAAFTASALELFAHNAYAARPNVVSKVTIQDTIALCQNAAEATADPEMLPDTAQAFVAAWTAACVVAPEAEQLRQAQKAPSYTFAASQNGDVWLRRANRLAETELFFVKSAQGDAKVLVRLAVRQIGDGVQPDMPIDQIASIAAAAAVKEYQAGAKPRPFSSVIFHAASAYATISLSMSRVIDIATVCAGEADKLGHDGIKSCTAGVFSRKANGAVGPILDPFAYESILQHGGIENMSTPQAWVIADVMAVMSSPSANRFNNATFFSNEPVTAQRGTGAWPTYTQVGTLGQATLAWGGHRFDNGIIIKGVLHLFEVPNYKVVIVNDKPQKPVSRPMIASAQIRTPNNTLHFAPVGQP